MKLPVKIAAIVFCGIFLSLVWAVFVKNFILLLLGFIVVAFLIWLAVVRIVLRPISKINQVAKIIASGNLGQQINVSSSDEIGELGVTINLIVKNLSKAFQGMANSLRDVKEKGEELANAKAEDDAILASIGDGAIAVDRRGVIIFHNKETENLLGWSKQDMIGRLWNEILVSLDDKGAILPSNQQPISQALSSGQKVSTVCCYAKKDGSIFPVAVTASPIMVGNIVGGIIIIFRDITKEKEVDRMKTEFISLASHQLRTPLSAIRWFTELLLDGTGGELNKEQKELVQNVSDSSDRMNELVKSLLNISRIESGRIIIDPEPTDLVELVKGIIKELEAKIKDRQQNLIISAHSQLPKISIDPRLISQVYMNLLTNAIKYTPKGGQIEVYISKKEDQIISQVSDNGYGIPKKDLPKLFQKFYRGENIVKIETDGTGLGLYLVKAIIDSSRGKIWVESEEGKGTTFYFSLPLSGTPAKSGEISLDS